MAIQRLRKKYLLLFPIQFIFVIQSFAQILIKGVVFDGENKLPIVGANIIELNTNNGVISDYSGRFHLTVNDTSKVRVSYIGYDEYIIDPQKFDNDTIKLYSDPSQIIDIDYFFYTNTYFIGYYGDFERLPYGFSAYYFRPYLFREPILFSGLINYKTDFNSNYDLKLVFTRDKILEFKKYQLFASASYQKRELNSLEIIDYDFILYNYIMNKFTVLAGFSIKEDFSNGYILDKGLQAGLTKYFGKTLTYVNGNITRYIDYSEYGLTILQRISDYKRFWSNLKFAIEYQYYKDYDEFNFIIRYANSF